MQQPPTHRQSIRPDRHLSRSFTGSTQDPRTDCDSISRRRIHPYAGSRVQNIGPGSQQEILSLRFAGRLRNREIAEVLRMNERTVSVTLLRALRKLRAQLAAEQPTAPQMAAPWPRESGA